MSWKMLMYVFWSSFLATPTDTQVKEIISYPPVRMIQHMNCRRVKEREIHFDSHMSGFVYKVRVHNRLLIKKEIPGPDTVDEFLYEINALSQLYPSKNVIQFYGVVVDDSEENVTGLLISYASRGALIDVIYDSNHTLPWSIREKWARQIVGGLSEIHEAGFVQGDFTLSNIVIDENDDAKIIDINRRGCPIGWEPPEATPLVDSNQRISMYIGVKSDLYQLGMVLWALATQEDEPDAYGRPLKIDAEVAVPAWYRRVVDTCLSTNPRGRVQAVQLLSWFPDYDDGSQYGRPNGSVMSVNGDANSRRDYLSPTGFPKNRTVRSPNSDWAFVAWGNHPTEDPFYYPSRGRSPPSPMPSNQGDYDASRYGHMMRTWSDTYSHAPAVPSVSDVLAREARGESEPRPRRSDETLGTFADGPYRFGGSATETSTDDSLADRGRSLSRDDYFDGETGPSEDYDMDRSTSTWGPLPSKHWRLEEEDHNPPMDDGSRTRELENKGVARPKSQADSGKDLTELASTPREHRIFFDHRGRPRSVSRGRSGRSSAGSSPLEQQRTDLMTTTAAPSSSLHHSPDNNDNNDNDSWHHPNPDHNDRSDEQREQDNSSNRHHHSPQPPPPSPPPSDPTAQHDTVSHRRSDDFLKGIGSAYDPPPTTITTATTTLSHDGNDHHDDDRKQHQQLQPHHHEMVIDDDDRLDSELDVELRQVLAAAA